MKTGAVCCALFLGVAAAARGAALDPSEQLQFADGLYARGLHELAIKEYSDLLGGKLTNAVDRALFRRAECYRQTGDDVAADRDFRRVYTEFPQSEFRFRAGYRRADIYFRKEQWDAAIDLYRGLLNDKPPAEIAAACEYFTGEAQLKKGRNDEAMAAFEGVRQRYAGSSFESYALLKLGDLLRRKGQSDQALACYRQAAAKATTDRVAAEAYFQAAEIHFNDHAYEQSAEAYARLISRYPQDPRVEDARLKAGWAAHYAGRYSEALRYVSEAEAAGRGGPEWLYLQANCERQLMKNDEALKTYGRLTAGFPESSFAPAARYELALTCYKMGRFQEAVDASRQLDLSGSSDLVRDVYWLLAESYASLGQPDEAIQNYRLLLKKFPQARLAADAAYRLAHLLQGRGEFIEAARYFNKLAADWPQSPLAPQALFASGYCYQKAGQNEEAARDWAALVAAHPAHALAEEARYQKAICEIRLKRFADAQATLGQLLQLHPKGGFRADALYWRGALLDREGRPDEAETELRAALKAAPRQELQREIEFALALALQKKGRGAEASKLLFPLLDTPLRSRFTPELLEWLGRERLSTSDASAVAQGLLAAKELTANPEPAWAQAGWCLTGQGLLARGERQPAADAFRKALDFGLPTAYAAQAALRLGEMAFADGDNAQASTCFDKAAALSGTEALLGVRAQAYAGLGRAARALGQHADAARYFMSVAILYDDAQLVPECLAGAAEAFRQLGQAEPARQAADELRARYPDSEPARRAAAAGTNAAPRTVGPTP